MWLTDAFGRTFVDIDYLLALQQLRTSLGGGVEQIFVLITQLGHVNFCLPVFLIIYLCVNKRAGIFLILTMTISGLLAQFIKIGLAINRPWVISSEVQPSAIDLEHATGYSFPSGHSAYAASVYGSIAWYFRRQKWVVALCVIVALLVMFSRNYLGYHTPQDVAAGAIVGLVAVAFTVKFFPWLESHPEHHAKLIAGVLVGCVIAILWVVFKPYPVATDASGAALVNPAEMMEDCLQVIGIFAGAMLGLFLEQRHVRFEVTSHWGFRVMRVGVAIAAALLFHKVLEVVLGAAIGGAAAVLICGFGMGITLAYLWPAAFVRIEAWWLARKDAQTLV